MRSAFQTIAPAALLAFALAAAPAAAQEKIQTPDVVVVTEGGQPKQRPGRVDSADHDKVAFTVSGRRTEIPATDVVEIRWGDAPGGYLDGLRALGLGDADGARKAFTDALNEKNAKPDIRDWVNEFANAGLGRAYVLLGDGEKAAEAFGKARSANPKSMVLDEILLGLVEAELLRGKGEAAAKAAEDLVAAARTAKRPAWELEAHLARARGELHSADFAGAVTAYDDAIRFAESAEKSEKSEAARKRLQRFGIDAAVAKGWALVQKAEASKATSDFDAARSYFDGLAGRHPAEPVVRASASNAAAVAKFAAGDAKGAVRQFMETEVVHFRAPTEVARSLWYQAECWKKLGNEQARQDRLKDLRDSFPGSDWARKAQ